MTAAAEPKAAEIGQPMNIAVVDAGASLVCHVRMDDAWLGSIDISINKAYTARAFDRPTSDLAPMAQSGEPLFGINTTNGGRVVIFADGIRPCLLEKERQAGGRRAVRSHPSHSESS